MFFTKRCPSGGTEYVSFELFLGILRGPGEGRGGAPGTVPLQNPEVTLRKACLRNADKRGVFVSFVVPKKAPGFCRLRRGFAKPSLFFSFSEFRSLENH